MTKEEAIKWIEEALVDTDTYWTSCSEALQKELDEQRQCFEIALTALRPVSRERVEKVWRGEWEQCFEDWRKQIEGDKCSRCGFEHYGTSIKKYHFCPSCGEAQTDEAVDMVMERVEALYEET